MTTHPHPGTVAESGPALVTHDAGGPRLSLDLTDRFAQRAAVVYLRNAYPSWPSRAPSGSPGAMPEALAHLDALLEEHMRTLVLVAVGDGDEGETWTIFAEGPGTFTCDAENTSLAECLDGHLPEDLTPGVWLVSGTYSYHSAGWEYPEWESEFDADLVRPATPADGRLLGFHDGDDLLREVAAQIDHVDADAITLRIAHAATCPLRLAAERSIAEQSLAAVDMDSFLSFTRAECTCTKYAEHDVPAITPALETPA